MHTDAEDGTCTLRRLRELEKLLFGQGHAPRRCAAAESRFSLARSTPRRCLARSTPLRFLELLSLGPVARACTAFHFEKPAERRFQRLDILSVDFTAATGLEHGLHHVDRRQQRVHDRPVNRDLLVANPVEYVFYQMSELRQLVHLDCSGGTLEGMRRTEYLVDGIVVTRIVFQYKNVAFEGLYLRFRFREEVLQQLFVLRIKVVAHSHAILVHIPFKVKTSKHLILPSSWL